MRRSSFIRKGAASSSDLGTRPGPHSQTLISLGLVELDKIFGGGLPLGTLLLILEDESSRHHHTLLRYFLGEGVACGQAVLLASAHTPSTGLAQFIPQQLKRGSAAAKEEDHEVQNQQQYTLRIAWQYRRYLQPPAARGQAGTARTAGASSVVATPQHSCDTGSQLQQGGSDPPASSPEGATEEPVGAGEGVEGKKVRIAEPSSGLGTGGRLRDWCHHFDLSKGLGEEGLAQSSATRCLDCCQPGLPPLHTLVTGAAGFVESLNHGFVAAGSSSVPAVQAESGEQRSAQTGVPAHPPSTPCQQSFHSNPERQHLGDPGGGGDRLAGSEVARSGGLFRLLTEVPSAPAVPVQHAKQIGRLGVLSLGSLDWWGNGGEGAGGCSEREVLLALMQLKAAVRERRCAAVVTLPTALHSAASVARLCHLADAVLALEGVADDSDIVKLVPDSASVAGLLHVKKLPSLGALAPPTLDVALYLIRNKRRRLSITPVEIDPDAEASMAEAASGGGGSTASLVCGGPPKSGDDALDF